MQTTKKQIYRRLQENKNFKRGKLPELANTAREQELPTGSCVMQVTY